MKYVKPSLKLLGLSVVMFIVYAFIGIGLLAFSNTTLLWIADGVMFVIYAAIIFATTAKTGKDDYVADELEDRLYDRKGLPPADKSVRRYNKAKGFITGAMSQIPILVVLWLPNVFLRYMDIPSMSKAGQTVAFIFDVGLRFYYIMYSQLFVVLPDMFPYICIAFVGVFVVICGLGYLSGPSDRKKEQIIIERNKQQTYRNSYNKGVTDR